MKRALAVALSVQLTAIMSPAALAEGPPSSNGVISNPTLVANQVIAKAQAVGAITQFMNKGAKECDEAGTHCHSIFGADDSPDYITLQSRAQSVTGAQSFNFMDKDGGSAAYQAQTGSLAVACGDSKAHLVAGVAVKVTNCHVGANGNTQASFKVCTAPSRSLPVSPPKNAVVCSTDPTSKNFKPPAGKVCQVPTCDTEPVGSLNGWSTEHVASWTATMPDSTTDADKAKNGLAMVFYPALDGSVTPDFKADSDNLTALKVVQSFVNHKTGKTAVGFRIAYRHKTTVTKDMMVAGQSAVPNPQDHTAQWATIQKLQGNALIPQYAAKYAKNGSECLRQISNGIAKTGEISVCDQEYSNESGIHPLEKTAKIAVEGEDCGTKPICVQKVVNTNTWKQTCRTDVPLSMRTCTKKTDYTLNDITASRTKPTEVCEEKRTTATYGCATVATGSASVQPSCVVGKEYSVSGIYTDYAGDIVQVTFVCNGDQLSGPIPLRFYAHGTRYSCGDSGFKTLNVDFTQTTDWVTGPNLTPDWHGFCNDVRTRYRVTGTCTAENSAGCAADIVFDNYTTTLTCDGDGVCTPQTKISASWSFNLRFTHPSVIVSSYSVNNQCAQYEAL